MIFKSETLTVVEGASTQHMNASPLVYFIVVSYDILAR